MSPSFEPDPAEERRREEAGVLMLRVGLALIDDARRGDGFETDEAMLTTRVGEILEALGAGSWSPEEAPIRAAPEDRNRVLLSAPTGEHSSDSALLRSDGILLEEYASVGIKVEEADTSELSPEQEEKLREARARFEAQMRQPRFRGNRLLRVLTMDPQSGSEFQLLAVELFDDGLIVHYTFDQDPESIESTMLDQMPESLEQRTGIRVEDDLGTEYYGGEGGGGGVQVVHGAVAFAPAVPSAARILRISSRSGTAELTL